LAIYFALKCDKKSILFVFSETNTQQIIHKRLRCSAITTTTTTTVGGRKLGNTLNQGKQTFCRHTRGKGIGCQFSRPFQTPNLDFCFLGFFSHRPGTPVKSLGIKGNAALNDGPKFAAFTRGLLIIEGGIFTSCFLILLSIIEGGVFA